jgi:hypothetical protein
MLHTKQTSSFLTSFSIGDRIAFYEFNRGDKGQYVNYQMVFATVTKVNSKTLIAENKFGEIYTTTRLAAQKIEDLF